MRMMTTIAALAISALMAPGASQAQYKCVAADGRVSFQQQACPGASAQSKLDLQVSPPPADAASARVASDALRADAMARERRVRELQFEIRDLEARIEDRSNAMSREVQRLQDRKLRAANTAVGVRYQHSLSAEMQAVTAKTQALNDVDLERLRRLRSELAAAQDAVARR